MREPVSTWIAERKLQLVDPNSGLTHPVIVRIGAPTPVQGSAAFGCMVQLDGLIGDAGPIQGVDSLQAVEEACRFVHNYLSNCRRAAHLQWLTGDSYFDAPRSE